jgi:hypothetical protein
VINRKIAVLVLFSALSCYFQSCDESEPVNGSDAQDMQEFNDLASEDFDVSADGSGGCDQDFPNITTFVTEHCDTHFPIGNCLMTGCDDCEVCYADVSCALPDPALDPLPCGCYGDGLCHKLCDTNADCLESEECTNIGWYVGRDVTCAGHARVCWSPDNPYSPAICP